MTKVEPADWHSFCTKGKVYPHSHGKCLFSISDTETTLISWITQEAYTYQTRSMINTSDTPINFYKVKAYIGVIGNESADAIAKHAAFQNHGHDEAFLPPSPMVILSLICTGSQKRTMRILAPLQNIKDKQKAHISKHHRLGDATNNLLNSGYF